MPNAIAYLALMAWPIVCVMMFRSTTPQRAIIWSLLAGYLVLPPIAEFDLPLVPDMDKFAIPSICAFALALFYLKDPIPLWPRLWSARLLMLGFVLGAIPTVLQNAEPVIFQVMAGSDPIVFETDRLPGLRTIDVASVLSNQLIVLLPLLLGRHYFATEDGMRQLLRAIMVAGLAYSVLALIEIRFSPQSNVVVYGFFQHSFAQMIRGSGFRPIVFLPHALWIALFFTYAVIAASALTRTASAEMKTKFIIGTLYLMLVLLLCKSMASIMYAAALVPLIVFGSVRLQLSIALGFAVLAVTYPMLRNFGVVPLDWILAQAEAVSPDRAQSLGYRFGNEEQLLERAKDKLMFGWGGWGRNLIREIETGQIITIPDGRWIITFGTYGWVGYLSEMGLLALPLVLLGLYARSYRVEAMSPLVSAVALILAITMVDMLLNDTLVPFVWLIAGAVLGYAERLRFEGVAAPQISPVLEHAPGLPQRKRTVL
ncbi:MAG: hypothetical protein AB8B82_10010 [Roseovarius sp.]